MNFAAWLGTSPTNIGTPSANEATRAAAAWRRIQDKPADPPIVFTVPKSATSTSTIPEHDLAAQTVRVEQDDTATPTEGPPGMGAKRKVIVFGIRNHATLADTDMQPGYRFRFEGESYRVVDLILTLGEVQGVCEAIA